MEIMKAVMYKKYGAPHVLQMQEIKKPVPKAGEVLIKIYATSVSAGDWRMRKADPFPARLFNGLLRPKKIQILGFELAGVVEVVGSGVTTFHKGDEVFAFTGLGFGGYAQYICLPEKGDQKLGIVSHKPPGMSFAEAAVVPVGGITALSFLKNRGALRVGQKVMIYGASGSVGTFAVQIAKAMGAQVIGVCSGRNIELVSSLGADEVIDYTTTDLTLLQERYDIIFDTVGKISKRTVKHLLSPGGRFLSSWNTVPFEPSILEELKAYIETGKIRAVIDKTYPLADVAEVHHYVQQFHKRGNVSITVVDV